MHLRNRRGGEITASNIEEIITPEDNITIHHIWIKTLGEINLIVMEVSRNVATPANTNITIGQMQGRYISFTGFPVSALKGNGVCADTLALRACEKIAANEHFKLRYLYF